MKHDNFDILTAAESRGQVIVRTSVIGMLINVILLVFKLSLGFFVNSIAPILDAVNNLSDALSSVVTIIGEKLASRAHNKKHPMGNGRIEYISSLIIAALVLYAGITCLLNVSKKLSTQAMLHIPIFLFL